MNARDAIKLGLATGDMIGLAYISDLSDDQLMMRPHADCNHINWQVGHIIASEHSMIESLKPGCMPSLPPGFADRYTKSTASSNDVSAFASKEELLTTYRQQRDATLAALETFSDSQFDQATGVEYAPTVGSMFSLQGCHWLMHCGQWVIVRRMLGKPAMF